MADTSTLVQILTYMLSCAHAQVCPPQFQSLNMEMPPASYSQQCPKRGSGVVGADPGCDPPPFILGPHIHGNFFNLGKELLLHCPWGVGALVGKGLRLVPLPQCPQPY